MNLREDQIIAVRSNKTIYKDEDKCIKVFHEGFSKADILNEALNLARVEETGLPIPGLLAVTMIDGEWAIVTQHVEGETLSQLMKKNPDRKEMYLEILVDTQLKILSKTCPMLNRLKEKMNRKISQTSLDATTRYDLHMRLESMPSENHVCHGDLCPSNLILTPDGQVYIIDWAHVTQGNACGDAARTYLLFYLQGDPDTAEKYLTLFCRKSDTARQQVQKWMPIVAASQSVKGNLEEHSLLMSWVDVVDYQ